jgi:PilZ domain-containing protein
MVAMGQERRNSPRKRILLDARWESMSRTHEARVDDVSMSGCFVNTYGHVEDGEQINLQIQLPSGEWLPLHGRVASHQPGVGFGMAFSSLSGKERAVLRELIATAKERAP